MIDVILEAILDSIKAFPILLLVYLLIEFLEHKHSVKFEHIVSDKKKTGPILGALIGIILNAILPGKDYVFDTEEPQDTGGDFEVGGRN